MDHNRKKRLLHIRRIVITALLLAVMLAGAVITASAAPVVIKNNETGEGTAYTQNESVARDRTAQDGTLVYGMTPVYPEDFKEGTYEVEALSSSQFFKITGTELTNQDGKLRAVITISSTSYAYVYPGTAAQAEAADPSEWIAADESTGYGRFALDAEALNKEMPCAAYSKKKETWYDRDIVFLASSLPEDALFIELSEDGETIADTQEAAMQVIYIAIAIIIGGGILNYFVKRRFYE